MNQACCYSRYGNESVLEWQDIPDQQPHANQVIVKVGAVSVNPVDWKIMAGQQKLFTGRQLRNYRIFGSDFSGTISEVGNPEKAARYGLTRGTPVMGMINPLVQGSFQKYLCIKIQACTPLAPHSDLVQMAGLPAAGTTAWQIVKHFNAQDWTNKIILLNGAAGGVGCLTLQMLVAIGAKVLAIASPERHRLLIKLGASACFDYKNQSAIEATAPWDALVDCHGSFLHSRLGRLVKRGGCYIPVSIPNPDIPATLWHSGINRLLHGIRAGIILAAPSPKILAGLAHMFENQKLHVPIDQIFEEQVVRMAVRKSISGHAAGKIIIRFAN